MSRGDGDVVEQTEPHGARAFGVVPRGTYQCKGAPAFVLRVEDMIDGGDRRAGGKPRNLVAAGRGEGVRIESHGAAGRLAKKTDVIRIVHARELGLRRRHRSQHLAAATPEIG